MGHNKRTNGKWRTDVRVEELETEDVRLEKDGCDSGEILRLRFLPQTLELESEEVSDAVRVEEFPESTQEKFGTIRNTLVAEVSLEHCQHHIQDTVRIQIKVSDQRTELLDEAGDKAGPCSWIGEFRDLSELLLQHRDQLRETLALFPEEVELRLTVQSSRSVSCEGCPDWNFGSRIRMDLQTIQETPREAGEGDCIRYGTLPEQGLGKILQTIR